jgi:hypothetical protein
MEIIPLGNNCLVAEHLKRLGVRQHSLPFDWVQGSDYSSLINIQSVIDTDFKDFFNYSVECQADDKNEGRPYAVNKKHFLVFYHQNYMSPEVGPIWRNKLADAIEKFEELIQWKKVTFIYSSNYTETLMQDLPYFVEDLQYFKAMCIKKRINANLVILNVINSKATKLDKLNWTNALNKYGNDDDFFTWRRLELDDSDGVWGSSEAFAESLKGAIK